MNRVLKAALHVGYLSLLCGFSQGALAQQAFISQTITLATNFCPQGFVPMQVSSSRSRDIRCCSA